METIGKQVVKVLAVSCQAREALNAKPKKRTLWLKV